MTIALEGVWREFGREVHLADVSLVLERGSLNVLLGPTLSGKTSLMRVLAGLDAPTRGRLLVEGRDVTGTPVGRRNVAMVYQQFINYPAMTVYENIASPLRVARLPGAEVEARVREAARLLRLEAQLGRRPLELSGGQQQRTAIARALVKRADLVLLDEPLANLDYKLREELREELPRLFAATGAVLVYATTEPSEALLLGGRTATLFEGRVTQFGPTPDVYRRPQDLATARVFSDPPLNSLGVVKRGTMLELETGGEAPTPAPLAGLPDGPFVLGFRAHHCGLGSPDDRLPAETVAGSGIVLPATVSVAEITGSESFVHLDVGTHRFVAHVQGVRRLEPGTPVTAHVDAGHMLVFDADGRSVGGPALARAA